MCIKRINFKFTEKQSSLLLLIIYLFYFILF